MTLLVAEVPLPPIGQYAFQAITKELKIGCRRDRAICCVLLNISSVKSFMVRPLSGSYIPCGPFKGSQCSFLQKFNNF